MRVYKAVPPKHCCQVASQVQRATVYKFSYDDLLDSLGVNAWSQHFLYPRLIAKSKHSKN